MKPPELLLAAQTELGESPVWDDRRSVLFFIDILERELHRLDWRTQHSKRIPLAALGGAIALVVDGSLIAALQTGLYRLDPDTGDARFIADPEPEKSDNRLNEGKCDPQGRFWFGSMSTIDRSPSGALYRLDRSGGIAKVFSDVVIRNALVWIAPDRMLFADSFRRVIWSFRSDPETGDLSERQVFVDCSSLPGIPDGIALDVEGCVWNAQFGAGRVFRYDARGRLVGEIALPATQVTSCVFAGDRLDQLVIVTTKRLLDDAERKRQVHAGDLFVCTPGVTGEAVPRYDPVR